MRLAVWSSKSRDGRYLLLKNDKGMSQVLTILKKSCIRGSLENGNCDCPLSRKGGTNRHILVRGSSILLRSVCPKNLTHVTMYSPNCTSSDTGSIRLSKNDGSRDIIKIVQGLQNRPSN